MALKDTDSNDTNSASSTIDLNTVTDPTIRAHIEQLLHLHATPSQHQPQNPFTHAPTPTILPGNPPTYAHIAALDPPHEAYPTQEEEIINDENPFLPVLPRNRRTPDSTTHTAHLTHGISGVAKATTDLWNETEVSRILNQDDLNNQRIRLAEGRVEKIHEVKRPSIWVKYFFPETIPTLTVKPNVLQQELAIDTIISQAALPFPVDRLYICTLTQVCPFDGVQCFLGFAAISPSSSLLYGSSAAQNRTVISQLYTLENRLFCLLQDPTIYRAPTQNPPPLLPHMTIKLPHVNHHTESFSFIIAGLPPQVPHNDVATLREIAADIFRAIYTTYKANPTPGKPFPEVLHRHTSRYHINQLFSVRPWKVTTTNPISDRGRGGRSPNRRTTTTTDRLLAIVTATHCNPAIDLFNVIHDLYNNGIHNYSICGGKLDISITPYHRLPTPNTPAFAPYLHETKAANTANYARSHVRILRDIPIHPSAITSPTTITRMVQNTPIVRAIVINLQHGRTNPSITCLLEHSTDTTINSPETLFAALANATPNIDISPTQSQIQQYNSHNNPAPVSVSTATPSRQSLPYHQATLQRNSHHFGSSLPKIVSTTSSSNRYHVLPNPIGGIANAGIYKGHFDIDNYRPIAEHVSYPYYKSFPTEWEAMQYLQLFHAQCTTRAKILFMNYNAPVEATNMNNPSPRLRQLIGTPTTTPREQTDFNMDRLEPFVILSRQEASRRMREQGLTPIDSYDFLPANHPREYHSPADLPIDHSLLPTNTTYPSISNLPTILPPAISTTRTTLDDDNMSQLSIHTQSSLNLTHTKRPRTIATSDRSISTTEHHATLAPTAYTTPHATHTTHTQQQDTTNPTHIAFVAPLATTRADIIATITATSSFTISPTIYFTPTLNNPTTKLVYITTTHPDHTTPAINILSQQYPNSAPRPLPSLPPSITTPQSIDTTPPAHTTIPTNCRIIQCPFYNNGFEEAPPSNPQPRLNELYQHGIGIHSEILDNTPNCILNTIGWFRCGPTCPQLLFGTDMTTDHRLTCPNYHASPPTHTTTHANTTTNTNNNDNNQPSHTPPNTNDANIEELDDTDDTSTSDSSAALLSSTDQNREIELSQTSLYDSCPHNRHHDLDTLIEQNTPPAIINATILRWINESSHAHTDTYDDDL